MRQGVERIGAVRWQRSLFDSAFTVGMVALVATIHFALGKDLAGRAPFLVSMLVVLISTMRGGMVQGIFAIILSLALEIALWGEWQGALLVLSPIQRIEISFFLVEGFIISLLAEYFVNGRRALRHSQKRFQVLFDAMPVGAMIHYQSRIVAANEPIADMFGYEQHGIIGSRPHSIVAPESVEEVTKRINTRSEESYRITGLRRDGTTFPVEVIGKYIDYQGHPMRVTVMRDLSDHLIARQRLEQMNELLELRVVERTTELNETVGELRLALENVQMLSGLLPICGSCKRIRDDDGYWSQVEDYITAHSAAEFSHSLCPSCLTDLREQIAERQQRQIGKAPM